MSWLGALRVARAYGEGMILPLPLVKADVDLDADLNMVTWALIAAGVALVLLGAAAYVRDAGTVRTLHGAAAVLGALVVVLALIRLL